MLEQAKYFHDRCTVHQIQCNTSIGKKISLVQGVALYIPFGKR